MGNIVSREGYKADTSNTHALTVLKEQQPKTVGDVRRILGLLNYYRKYIPNFSQIATPLFDLLKQPKEIKIIIGQMKIANAMGKLHQSKKFRGQNYTGKHSILLSIT